MTGRSVFVYAMTALAAVAGTVFAQARQEAIFSPLTASVFIKTAQEIFADSGAVDPAMRFLEAASAMDRNAQQLAEPVLRIGSQSCIGVADYSEPMLAALGNYLGKQADLEVALSAIRCMLTRLDARQDREVFLDRLVRRYASANPVLGSELLTQLGLLASEKADIEGASRNFSQALAMNPYNFLAFDKLRELYDQQGQSLPPEAELITVRLMLDVNPFDFSAAVRYADMLRRMEMYTEAAGMYEYTERVFGFLSPDQPLPQRVYLPRLISMYRSERLYGQCLELAERVRATAPFDLMLEAVAGRAAAKSGRTEQAKTILEEAAGKAEQMLGRQDVLPRIYPEHLAWFYSFVLERPDSALAWSNQAFNQAPERQGVKAIFAYTLALNGQTELAKQYAESLSGGDPITDITMAMVKQQQDRTAAIELLRKAIAAAPDTFEAEKARALLTDWGSEYLSPPAVQQAEKALEARFGARMAPTYADPRQRFTAKLLFSGGDVLYGAEFDPRLVIENTGASPLVIQDGAMLAGLIRVDASVRGDLTLEIPNLLVKRIRPGRPIQPNEHIFIPLELNTGSLRRLLMTYPQATVDIEFAVYLDPVVGDNGQVANALAGTTPVRTTLRRRSVNMTRDFLMQRLDALAKGQEGQKMQAARLFVGLLAEQEAFRQGQEKYPCTELETTLLVDAVRRSLADENWRLRVDTMDALLTVVIPTDYTLIESLSANLNHSQWPVRFMATYLLSRLQGETFRPVLDWKAKNDPNVYNQRLAVSLGGKEPPKP